MTSGTIPFAECGTDLQWSVATRAKVPGYNGDGYLLGRDAKHVYAHVLDGIGSGKEAQAATDLGLQALSDRKLASMEQRFQAVHQTLQGGRGAAMGVAKIDMIERSLYWAAVGDIGGVVIQENGTTKNMIQIGGTLGINPGRPRTMRTCLTSGDVIVVTSDGISRRFCEDLPITRNVAELSGEVLDRYGRQNDDCIVLSMKVLG